MDYKNLLLKCFLNNQFFFKFNRNHLLIKLSYCTKCLLSIQTDFQVQKYKIKEFI